MSNWKELLIALENPQYSPEVEDAILQLWVDDIKSEDIIVEYVQTRLKEGISPELLNNMFNNIYLSKDLEGLGETFNNAIIGPFLKGRYQDHFYHVLTNDSRALYQSNRKSLLDNLFFHLVHGKSITETLSISKQIPLHSKYNLEAVYVSLITAYINNGKRSLLPSLFDLIGHEFNYKMMSLTISKETHIFNELLKYLVNDEFLQYTISQTIDESELAQAIINKVSSYHLCYYLNNNKEFCKIVLDTTVEKPLLWAHIINVLIETHNFTLLIKIAEFQPKKKILKILLEHAGPNIVNDFYKTYKNDPEVKTFLPFT